MLRVVENNADEENMTLNTIKLDLDLESGCEEEEMQMDEAYDQEQIDHNVVDYFHCSKSILESYD